MGRRKKVIIVKELGAEQLIADERPKKQGIYYVNLVFPGRDIKLEGDNLVDIFGKIKPEMVKGKGVLKVRKDDIMSRDVNLHPLHLKKLMINRTFKEIMAKRIDTFLKAAKK